MSGPSSTDQIIRNKNKNDFPFRRPQCSDPFTLRQQRGQRAISCLSPHRIKGGSSHTAAFYRVLKQLSDDRLPKTPSRRHNHESEGGDLNVPLAYSRPRSGLFGSRGSETPGGLEGWLSRGPSKFATGSERIPANILSAESRLSDRRRRCRWDWDEI